MRNFLSIILSFFYLTLSTGAAIDLHYCGGELESLKLNSGPASCCCGDANMPDSCCENEELILDIDVDQQLVSQTNIVSQNIILGAVDLFGLDCFNNTEVKELVADNYVIPPPNIIPKRILNCSLTFYG